MQPTNHHSDSSPGGATRRVDLVAAVRNEEKDLPGFIERVQRLRLPDGVELGMIFVEDSSTDGTVAMLRRYSRSHPGITYYALKKGYGQCAAIALGLKMSRADAVVMMDADGEHPPELIPGMVEHYLAGADIVQCVRKRRDIGRFYRRAGSAVFNKVARLITGVSLEDQTVYFRLVSAAQKDRLLADNKWLRFLRISGEHLQGARIERVPFDAQTREDRQSTYGLWRLMQLAADALLSLVSGPRFGALVLAALVVAVGCLVLGRYALGGALAAVTLLVAYRYVSMVTTNVLDRLEVVEKGP